MPRPHSPFFPSLARTLLAAPLLLGALGCRPGSERPQIGLITKTDANPYFVALRQRVRSGAEAAGVSLLTATGQRDGDNASQVSALETMVAKGARAILITPSDARAIVPAIRRARERGVMVIALDSPTEPPDAVDALLATNNYTAGQLIGAYGRRRLSGAAPRIATLDLFPGHPVGAQRHNGFLQGFSLASLPADRRDLARPAAVVCMADTHGDQARGQTAMENCLQKNPDINVVYAINEPAAAGAYTALRNRGREREVLLLTIDGSCRGVQAVASGRFTATSQQQPLVMADRGVQAAVAYATSGRRTLSGFHDTGVNLIASRPMAGVTSLTPQEGLRQCWGPS